MNILTIGTDQSLVGGQELGDAIARHREYGRHVEHLDIIVYSNKRDGLRLFTIAENVTGYPSNSILKAMFIFDAVKLARSIARSRRIDVVVCQDPFIPGLVGVIVKAMTGARLQVNFHGDFWGNAGWLRERWLNVFFLLISRMTVRRADAVRVMSTGQQTKLVRQGVSRSKVHVIPTPVNLDRFTRERGPRGETQQRLRGKKVVIMVGRKDKVKDFRTLFEAFTLVQKQIPNAALLLVGNFTGDEAAAVQVLRGACVVATGLVPAERLPALYQQAEVAVLCSRSESYGKVLVEANASGLPVVATRTTGALDIVHDGENGFLVDIGDSVAVADRIVRLLADRDLSRRMGGAGKKMMLDRFDSTRGTMRIISLWNNLAKLKVLEQ